MKKGTIIKKRDDLGTIILPIVPTWLEPREGQRDKYFSKAITKTPFYRDLQKKAFNCPYRPFFQTEVAA